MLICLLLFGVTVSYSTASPTKTVPGTIHPAGDILPRASRCVDGAPASLPTEGGWEIDYAAVAIDSGLSSHYNVNGSWYKEHYISSMVPTPSPLNFLNLLLWFLVHKYGPANPFGKLTQSMSIGPGNDLYGAFKCQFACNGADPDCVSYFGRYGKYHRIGIRLCFGEMACRRWH